MLARLSESRSRSIGSTSGGTPQDPVTAELGRVHHAGLAATAPTLAIALLAACGLVVSLLQTMVVPLIPQFPALLSIDATSASWLLTSTLVAGAVSAPVLGRLGDMYGKRRMLLVSLALILGSSALAAVAQPWPQP